jgi:hypothetical protein
MPPPIAAEKPIWYVVLKDFGITTVVALACMYGLYYKDAQATTERASLTAAALAERKEMLVVLKEDRKEFRESIADSIKPMVEELEKLNKKTEAMDERLNDRLGNIEALLRPRGR